MGASSGRNATGNQPHQHVAARGFPPKTQHRQPGDRDRDQLEALTLGPKGTTLEGTS